MGCAGMFIYLTGFRAAEVRPFHVAGLGKDSVRVVSAKRKTSEDEVTKLRDWSPAAVHGGGEGEAGRYGEPDVPARKCEGIALYEERMGIVVG
jgi:hypothetical protein